MDGCQHLVSKLANEAFLTIAIALVALGPVYSESAPGDELLKAKSLTGQCRSLESSGDYSRAACCRLAMARKWFSLYVKCRYSP
jgi:hypothetical protein